MSERSSYSEGAKGLLTRQLTSCLPARGCSLVQESLMRLSHTRVLLTRGTDCNPLTKMNQEDFGRGSNRKMCFQRVQKNTVPSPNAPSSQYQKRNMAPLRFIRSTMVPRGCFLLKGRMGLIYSLFAIKHCITMKFALNHRV